MTNDNLPSNDHTLACMKKNDVDIHQNRFQIGQLSTY